MFWTLFLLIAGYKELVLLTKWKLIYMDELDYKYQALPLALKRAVHG